jgi:hypothetical protein
MRVIRDRLRYGEERVFPNASDSAGKVEYKFDGHYFADALLSIGYDEAATPPLERAEVRDALEIVLLEHEQTVTQIGALATGALTYINNVSQVEFNITTAEGLIDYSKQIFTKPKLI